jgi:hypothetical protein
VKRASTRVGSFLAPFYSMRSKGLAPFEEGQRPPGRLNRRGPHSPARVYTWPMTAPPVNDPL